MSFPSAVAFCVISAIGCTTLIGVSTGALQISTSAIGHAAAQAAVSTALDVHGPGGVAGDELCLEDACAAITDIKERDGIRTVTVEGAGTNGATATGTRDYAETTGSHLVGVDAQGRNVWVTEPDAGTFTWHQQNVSEVTP